MTRLFCILLTLLFSVSGPATGANSDFWQSSIAANGAVPQVLQNKAVGAAARDAIAASRPGSLIEQNFRVTGGLRRVDVLDGATAIESKVGRTSLGTSGVGKGHPETLRTTGLNPRFAVLNPA
jgi:hypothetical protein